jgi:crossover junction endodeoxyribonuclease RuvC
VQDLTTATRRIIGIDPGLRVTGYGVLEWQSPGQSLPGQSLPGQFAPGQSEASESLGKSASRLSPPLALGRAARNQVRIVEAGVIRVASGQNMELRLRELKKSLDEILAECQPTVMAVEQLYAHYERTQPAILMGHARGVILLAAAEQGIPVTSYSATSVKKTISGHGRAPKEQMQAAVCHHLGLKQAPEPHDVADALAIALCHLFSQQIADVFKRT